MHWLDTLLQNHKTVKVLHEPPKYKPNEIPIDRLDRSEEFRPCRVLTQDGKGFFIIQTEQGLIIQNIKDLSIFSQSVNNTLYGAIRQIKEAHPLKDVRLFPDQESLVQGSKSLNLR